MAAAVILVIAPLDRRNRFVGDSRGLLIPETGFVIVDPAPVVVDRADHQDAERLVVGGPAKACPGVEGEVGDACVTLQLLATTQLQVEERLASRGRGLRRDVDRAAQRLGILLRQVALGHGDGADEAGRNRVHRHGAAGARRRAGVGGRQAQPAEGRAVQIGVEAADVDVASFARIRLQGDTRNAAYGLTGVDVRKPGDLAGRRDIDEIRRLLLGGQRDVVCGPL